MQEKLHRYADHLRNEGKIPVEARVGVNTGEVVVRTIEIGGHTEYTPVGHVTNLAARMQTAAPSGSIAASEATQRLCEGYFEFRALGPTAVKGLDAPVEVHEVMRAGPLRTHFQLAARRGSPWCQNCIVPRCGPSFSAGWLETVLKFCHSRM